MTATLIQHLQNAALYDHPVHYFKVLETHISWVILTGQHAYKIKKPLNLEFLDFSTLEKRRHYCQEELRLNQRLAPQIYEQVVSIRGTEENPHFEGDGPVIEYALKMHEFSQEMLFTQLLVRGELTGELIDALSRGVARFHVQAMASQDAYQGTPEQMYEPVVQNFEQIRGLLKEEACVPQLDRLQLWAEETYHALYPLLSERKTKGFIRDCHGDMHLGNIVLFSKQPVIFDCIEFNEPFRWTDTMADVGFLAMDLDYYGRSDLARRFVSGYLQYTGDYAGLAVLAYYQSYRAVVRAKIALFRQAQSGISAQEFKETQANYRTSMDLAETYMHLPPRMLVLMYGLSGSGKSTVAKVLVEESAAIQIRSDVERKRLQGLPMEAVTDSPLYEKMYTPDMTERTYQRLSEVAAQVLSAGYRVIIDATFLKAKHRQKFIQLAKKNAVPWMMVECHAPVEFLHEAVVQRGQGRDASEADNAILTAQLEAQDPLSAEERARTVSIDTRHMKDRNSIVKVLMPALREKV